MPLDPFAKILIILKNQGSIPKSQISKKSLQRLQPLIDTKTISVVKKGVGQRYTVNNEQGLQRFLQYEFPAGVEPLESLNMTPRCQAVAFTKDAHRSKSKQLPLFVRGFNNAKLSRDGAELLVAELTAIAGGAGITLTADCDWSFSGKIVTVENPELFFSLEKIIPDVDIAISTSGKMSDMLVDWLSSDFLKKSHIVHCGDFDPVGLHEYLRIKKKCARSVRFYIPENLVELFKFSNHKRLDDQVKALAIIRKSTDVDVKYVVSLMDKYNGGLDQEIVLKYPLAIK